MKESKYEIAKDNDESKSKEGLNDDEMDIPRKHVRIEDVSPEAFGWILRNLTKPTLPKNPSILANIFYIIDKYMIDSLRKDYLFLVGNTTKPSDLCELFKELLKIGLYKVMESIIAELRNATALKWLELLPTLPLKLALATVEFLPAVDEDLIWEGCVKWAKGQVKEKEKEKEKRKKRKRKREERRRKRSTFREVLAKEKETRGRRAVGSTIQKTTSKRQTEVAGFW